MGGVNGRVWHGVLMRRVRTQAALPELRVDDDLIVACCPVVLTDVAAIELLLHRLLESPALHVSVAAPAEHMAASAHTVKRGNQDSIKRSWPVGRSCANTKRGTDVGAVLGAQNGHTRRCFPQMGPTRVGGVAH